MQVTPIALLGKFRELGRVNLTRGHPRNIPFGTAINDLLNICRGARLDAPLEFRNEMFAAQAILPLREAEVSGPPPVQGPCPERTSRTRPQVLPGR